LVLVANQNRNRSSRLDPLLTPAVKLVWEKLTQYNADVTPTFSKCIYSAHILEPFCKLCLGRNCDNGMYTNPQVESS
jgi:hypothetical protein